MQATLIVAARDLCGEGPLWEPRAGALYWLDLYRPTLHRLEAASGRHVSSRVAGAELLACLLRRRDDPHPDLVTRDAVGGLAPAGAGSLVFRPQRCIVQDDAREAVNDGKTHPSGTVWLGTADTKEESALGRLLAFPPDGRQVLVDKGFVVSNGPAFAPDGSAAYFSDSAGRRVLRYPLTEEGLPAGPAEIFAAFTVDDGHPDGLTVDAEGFLWVAMWDGWGVRRLAPDGRPAGCVALPVPRVTACAFGGPDLSTLYVTTATFGLDQGALDAGAGGLFALAPGVRGLAEPFAAI